MDTDIPIPDTRHLDATLIGPSTTGKLISIPLHRSSNMDTMPVFKDELLRRLWCCVYALERELGLQTEGPLLIQDSNVDFALPRNLGDFWLSSHREDSSNSCDLRQELEEEVAKTRLINVSFIKDKTWHARAVNRIWGALHHEFSTKSEISCILIESLEYSAQKAEQLSKMGTDSVDEKQKPCWNGDRALQKKHESLMRIVCQALVPTTIYVITLLEDLSTI